MNDKQMTSLPMPGSKESMTIIGRLDGHEDILVVSIPPQGSARFYCMAHDILFTINGPWCERCSAPRKSSRAIPI